MNSFNKLLLILATVLAVGVGVAVAAGTNGGSSSDPASTVLDVSGPCDEAEHANDPRCAGAQVPEDNADDQGEDASDDRGHVRDHAEDDAAVGDDNDKGEDISGPCDEAEHANDPRCTGTGGAGDDQDGIEDNSGPGSSHDQGDDNSGPGGGDDDGSGHSGPGGGDDD